MKKRLISILLTIAMFAALLPTAFAANSVTRAEWISQLVEAFSMTVEDDSNMPDNYFSDITKNDSYYRDILLAVEFGVIDLEAGETFEPNESATREFAARTLNSCLQFQLDEGAQYTFSEADSVTYPDDIQAAINRNWFTLSGGNFLPEQAITSAEATAMLADAKGVIDSEVIDENYNSSFEFADGVIVIPETAQTSIDENNTITIIDSKTEINTDDIFVVYTMGIPVAFKATEVETVDNATVIDTTKDGAEGAIVSADAQGKIAIDIEDFEPEEATTYSITNTRTNETERMEIQLYSIDYDKASKTVTASHNIKIGSGIAGNISAKISNIDLGYKFNGMDYEVVLTGDTNVTTSVSFDFNDYAGIPKSISLGSVRIMGIGKVSLDVECSISGGIAMSWDGALKVGVAGIAFKDARLIKSFTKKGFTITAEVNIGIGLKLSAGLDIVALSGTLYATIGAKGSVKAIGYSSGTPAECATIKAYMYAAVGADVMVFGWKPSIPSKDIFTESNSPIRVCYHYEDGKLVDKCTRGAAEAGDAYVTYTTPTNSTHFNPSPSYGQGSYGGSDVSKPVIVWEYKVENGNAIITKYNGTAAAVAIPSKLDGYIVTTVGSRTFYDNQTIRTVIIPNTITTIDSYAFRNCNGLTSVIIPNSVTGIGEAAFENCVSLTSITIGNNVSSIGKNSFRNCTGLKIIYWNAKSVNDFEYFSKVSDKVFYNAGQKENGIHVIFGDSVESIPSRAFERCTSLTSVTIGNSVTSIGEDSFYCCTSLTSATIGNSVTSIGGGAFCNTGLTSVTIPNSVTSIGGAAFEATNLTSVAIPDNVTSIGNWAFYNCIGLTGVTIGSSVTSIGEYAFAKCTGLTNVTIPDSVITIGEGAFNDCNSLKEMTLPFVGASRSASIENETLFGYILGLNGNINDIPKSLRKVTITDAIQIPSKAFSGCPGLTSITIPDSVTSIGYAAFCDCTGLTSVTIPDSVTSIGDMAFCNCTGLEEIYWNAKNVCDFSSSANTSNIIFYGAGKNGRGIEVIFGDSVESIPAGIFHTSVPPNIISVTIGNNVSSIGGGAFLGCTGLTSIKIPDSVTKIDDYALYNCTGLTDVTIGNGVENIGNHTFGGCKGLTDVYYSGSEEAWSAISIGSNNVCLTDTTIHYNITSTNKPTIKPTLAPISTPSPSPTPIVEINTVIAEGKYSDNLIWTLYSNGCLKIDGTGEITSNSSQWSDYRSEIRKVEISDNVTSIGNAAFFDCANLTSINIPNSVTTIGIQAFDSCSGLKEITIPYQARIYGNAFLNCSDDLVIKGYVGSKAEEYAKEHNITFEGLGIMPEEIVLSGQYSDTLSWSLSNYGVLKINGTGEITSGLEQWDNYYRSEIKKVEISDGVTSIGSSAFYECRGLTEINIPDSITKIGWQAFERCYSLTKITIPDSVNSISYCAFCNCYKLTQIDIPDSVTSIDIQAFYNCTALTEITIPYQVKTIADSAFKNCSNDLVIKGYIGSKAEEYAKSNNITFRSIETMPSASPTLTPSPTPTVVPTATPSIKPTNTPSPSPSIKPTNIPTPSPSTEPTGTPIPTSSVEPTNTPLPSPSVEPTSSSAPSPSIKPTDTPTPSPNVELTESPLPNTECVKITAIYTDDGALKSIMVEKIKISEITPPQNTATNKIFYWESLNSMKPIELN